MKVVLAAAAVAALSAATVYGQSRIVGGERAGRVPFFASLVTPCAGAGACRLCGAALVHEGFVVSAAHCVQRYFEKVCVDDGRGVPGSAPGVECFSTRRVFIHPGYSDMTLWNDIAVIQLDGLSTKTPVELSTSYSTDPSGGQTVTVLGFGQKFDHGRDTAESAAYSCEKCKVDCISEKYCRWGNKDEECSITKCYDHLKLKDTDVSEPWLELVDGLERVQVKIQPNEKCNQQYSDFDGMSQVCAGSDVDDQDSCYGDSGGPLYHTSAGKNTLVGLVSYGYSCGLKEYPGVYTRVSVHSEWIEGIVRDNAQLGGLDSSQMTPQDTANVGGIVGGVIGALAVLAAGAVLFFVVRKRRAAGTSGQNTENALSSEASYSAKHAMPAPQPQPVAPCPAKQEPAPAPQHEPESALGIYKV